MTTALRPLSLGELLDRTFQLYRGHFLVVVGIVSLPHLAVLAAQLAQVVIHPPTRDPSRALAELPSQLLWLLIVLAVTLVAGALAQSATVFAVSEMHLERPVSIGRAYAGISGRIGGLLFITVAVGLLIGLGTIFCIVPGILLLLRWSFVLQTAVLERADLGEAMSRSADLTSGDRGRLFMIYFLYFVLALVCGSLWQIPTWFALFAAGQAGTAPPTWALVVSAVGGFVTQCLVGPLLHIAITLSYYDARVRKEAFDLEHMLAQLAP